MAGAKRLVLEAMPNTELVGNGAWSVEHKRGAVESERAAGATGSSRFGTATVRIVFETKLLARDEPVSRRSCRTSTLPAS